jgi:O-antigen ligase
VTSLYEALGEISLVSLGVAIWRRPLRAAFDELRRTLPLSVLIATILYLCHVLFEPRTALAESLGIAMLWLGWAIAKRQIRPSFHILYYPLALYGIGSSLSAIFAPRSIHQFAESGLWAKMLIFPTAIILFREVPLTRALALPLHLFYGTCIALIGLYQFAFLGWRDLEHRITGPSTHVMTYSGLLLPLSLLALIFWLHERNPWYLFSAAVMTLALLLTFTRSVWLGWVAAAGTLLIMRKPRALIYAAPALILFVTFLPLPLFGRLISTFDPKLESNVDRIRMFEAGVEIIKDYPMLGVGPANIKEYYPLYRKPDAPRFRIPHLHNNVVQIWAERGIVALLGYLLFLALFLRECAKAWRGPQAKWAQAGVAAVLALTYAGLFEFNFRDTEVFYLMLDLFALIVVNMETSEWRVASSE